MPPSWWYSTRSPFASSLNTIRSAPLRYVLTSRLPLMVSASRSVVSKISGSGVNVIVVPVPRTFDRTVFSFVAGTPRS